MLIHVQSSAQINHKKPTLQSLGLSVSLLHAEDQLKPTNPRKPPSDLGSFFDFDFLSTARPRRWSSGREFIRDDLTPWQLGIVIRSTTREDKDIKIMNCTVLDKLSLLEGGLSVDNELDLLLFISKTVFSDIFSVVIGYCYIYSIPSI